MVRRGFPVLLILSLPWLWGSCSSTSSTSAPKCSGDDTAQCMGENGCMGTRTCVEGTWSICDCGDVTNSNTSNTSNASSGGSAATGAGGPGSGGTESTNGTSSDGSSGSAGSPDSGSSGGTSNTSGSGGSAGSGGTGGVTDSTVRGQVINHWRQPVPDVTVMLGDDLLLTDDEGRFEFENAPDVYDIYLSFVNDDTTSVLDAAQGWMYQGLTRRDPTLQVYGGLPGRRAWFAIYPTVTEPDNRTIGVTLGGEHVTWSRHIGANGQQAIEVAWYGPLTTTVTAHGLAWQEIDGLPTSYNAFEASTLLAFDSTATMQDSVVLDLDLSDDEEVTSGTLSGTVASAGFGSRNNSVYLRFPSTNGVILLVDHDVGALAGNFSYLAPSVAGGALTFVAREDADEGFALAYQSGISPGTADMELAIPEPPTFLSPPVDAELTSDTVFEWSSDFSTNVWILRNANNGRDRIYVVTNEKELTLPTFPDGFDIVLPETYYTWQVETHGELASVDDAAGPTGFINEFNLFEYDSPEGPRVGSSTYTISDWGYVNTVTQ